MRYKVLLVMLVVLTVLFYSCSSSGNKVEKIKVSDLSFRIDDRTNEPDPTSGATAFRTLYLEIDQPSRWTEISDISITDPIGTLWSFDTVADTQDETTLSDAWDPSYNEFDLVNLYSSSNLHSVQLGEYTIEITTEGLGTSIFNFTVSSIDGQTSGKLYSQTGSGTSESEILGVPTLTSAEVLSGNVDVEFTYNDTSVQDGYLWLYDSVDDSNYMGFLGYFSDYGSAPSSGITNSYSLPLDSFSTNPKSVQLLLQTRKQVSSSYRIYYRSRSNVRALPYS